MRIYLVIVLVLVLEKRKYEKHDWKPVEADDVHSALISAQFPPDTKKVLQF